MVEIVYAVVVLTACMCNVAGGRTKYVTPGINCEVPPGGRRDCVDATNVCSAADCCFDNSKAGAFWCFKPWGYVYGHEDLCNNLLVDSNWDFEDPVGTEWRSHTCDVTQHDWSRTGVHSGLAFNRENEWSGVRKRLKNLEPGVNFYYSCFINFLDVPNNGLIYEPALRWMFKFLDGSSTSDVIAVNNVYPSMTEQWIHFAGIFKTPDFEINYVELYFVSVPSEVDYLLDSAVLHKLEPDPHWKEKASERIQQTRKNVVTLRGSIPDEYYYQDIYLTVEQTRHEFGFGASIHADVFNSPNETEYRDFFFDNFERTTLTNDLKWKPMEWHRDDFAFERVDTALATLDAAKIPVHGHSIFWNNLENNPNWVQDLYGEDMKEALDHRVQYVVPRYAGRVDHWDVCNEVLGKHEYEDRTGNPNLLLEMFQNVSTLDGNTDLFLNEYQVFTDPGRFMSAMNNRVRYLLGEGAKLDGLGIQNHHVGRPDIEVLLTRLDFVAQTGLPIYISELTVSDPDVTKRAEYLDDFLHVFFSDPRVKAVTHWGFVDIHQGNQEHTSLADGDTYTINEAGQRWHDLVKVLWRTNEEFSPPAPHFDINFSAFHGEYRLKVYNGETLLTDTTFDLPSGADKAVDVTF